MTSFSFFGYIYIYINVVNFVYYGKTEIRSSLLHVAMTANSAIQ